jgi:hypothetical protein
VLRNSNGKIVDIREKVIISNEALGGIYVFGKKVNIQQYIHDLKLPTYLYGNKLYLLLF